MRGRTAAAVGLMVVLATTMGVVAGPLQRQGETGRTATVTLKVEGMTCGGCEAAVKMAARKVEGVRQVVASYARGTAEVTYDPARTTPEAIAKAITEGSGFKAHAPKSSAK